MNKFISVPQIITNRVYELITKLLKLDIEDKRNHPPSRMLNLSEWDESYIYILCWPKY